MSNTIWINEFHYDNTGTDVGEFIEVAGLAGTDLSGWALVLYNGADGFAYSTLELGGIIPDQSGGVGTLSFAYPENGIQNGGPDGIALVDPFGTTVEFISYEGSFDATDFFGSGTITSVDVGVAELGADAVGGSIARVGSGDTNSWQLVTDDTPGALNNGQTFAPAPTADFVNLQFPASTSTLTGGTTDTIYGRIFEAGLTEAAGAPSNVIAQIGYGPAGTDPTSSAEWVWADATYNVQVGNDDEYMATLTLPTAGSYAYTFRFGIDDGLHPVEYTYADLDGAGTNPGLSFDPAQLGSLTVNWEILTGTESADTINGDDNAEIINGLGGADHLNGGGGDDQIVGGQGTDVIQAGAGDDLVEGGRGNDTLSGGIEGGIDTLSYANASGAVQVDFVSGVVTGADGTDSIGLFENVIGSAFNDTIVANAFYEDNRLQGGDGDDTLDGGDGNDTLDGGNGSDTAQYGRVSDAVSVDLLLGTTSKLGSSDILISIENVTGSSFDDVISGDFGANVIDGGVGADNMNGLAGDDRYWVDNVGDVVTEGEGDGTDEVRASISYVLDANVENLVLLGSAALHGTGNGVNNILTGNSGANILDGRAGADSMRGGDGNDTYYIDNTGDRVIESSLTGGVDTVRSSISLTLGANVENLVLTGSADLKGTGNDLANTLTGNSGANLLNGLAGADKMKGGDGNDTYYVDNSGDRAVEASATGGVDTVRSSVSFTLGLYVENLVLTGTGAVNGTGNGVSNAITGNDSANVLRGNDGNDSLLGKGGNDFLYGGTSNDVVDGGLADDWLEGGAGQDQLTGGTGADKFVFRDGDFAGLTTATCDRIHDFSHAEGDKIRLSYVDANSANGNATNEAFAFIGTNAFHNVAGELRYEVISGNTYVSGDTNGDGSADFMFRVDGTQSFVGSDFVL